MRHHVITKREHTYPFKPYWGCLCGVRFSANVMGRPLYEEFGKHLREVHK